MVDFFNDVEEDLRATQMRSLGKTALPWAIGIAVVAVLGAGGLYGWSKWRESDTGKASIAYDGGLKALAVGDKATADRDFGDARRLMAGGYKSMAMMQQAGVALAQNRDAEAEKTMTAAVGAAGGDRILADLATLKAVWLVLDTAPLTELETRLKPLMDKDRPFRAEAYEALALAQLKAGRLSDARANLAAIKLMLDAPDGVRQRADMAIQTIDAGGGPRLVQAAQAAATLKPDPAPLVAPSVSSAGSPAPQAGAAPQ